MHIVSFLGLKGGTGKTMLATQTVVRAIGDYSKPAIVDLDPSEGGATLWAKDRSKTYETELPFFLAGISDPEAAVNAAKLMHCDLLVMDGPPGAMDATRIAASNSDVVVLPCKLSIDDLERAAVAAKVCSQSGCTNIVFAINDVLKKSAASANEEQLAANLQNDLIKEGYNVAVIRHRLVFIDSRNDGIGVAEMTGRGVSEAKKDIDSLCEKIAMGLNISNTEVGHV